MVYISPFSKPMDLKIFRALEYSHTAQRWSLSYSPGWHELFYIGQAGVQAHPYPPASAFRMPLHPVLPSFLPEKKKERKNISYAIILLNLSTHFSKYVNILSGALLKRKNHHCKGREVEMKRQVGEWQKVLAKLTSHRRHEYLNDFSPKKMYKWPTYIRK